MVPSTDDPALPALMLSYRTFASSPLTSPMTMALSPILRLTLRASLAEPLSSCPSEVNLSDERS